MRILIFLLCCSLAHTCTDFLLQAKDGAWINGRSMEFALDLQSKLVVFPRGQKVTSQGPEKKSGLQWVSKYGFLGATALGKDHLVVEGLNERGLSFGALWLPGTQYPTVPNHEMAKALDFVDMGAWMLGNFATVAEVKQGLEKVKIWGHAVPPLTGIPPLHVAVHDAQGNSLVIEFVKGEVKVYDNLNGVLTNYPTFDWHLINMQNYVNLNALNASSIQWKGGVLGPTGQGSGLVGLPGDWTPPARFVRASVFLHFAQAAENAADGVNLAEHILNTVDIPMGDVREKGSSGGDYTQWVTIQDLTNRVVYFRSYKDLCLKMIDLKKLNFDLGAPGKGISLVVKKGVVDMTSTFNTNQAMKVELD